MSTPSILSDAIAMVAAVEATAVDPQPAAAPRPEPGRVLDNTLCLALSINRLGVRRKASLNAVTVDADKALLGLSKKLLNSPNLIRINRIVAQTRDYLKSTALPSFFKSAVYLVPDMMVPTIEAKLVIFKAEFEAAVADFLVEYPSLIDEMAGPLGVLYNPTDYPTVGKVAASFGMEWRFVGFDVPGRLRSISAAMYEREREKHAQEFALASEEITTALRVGMADLINGMVEKLKPTDDGKRRRLTTASVEKLQTFLATFDMRNVTNDAELAALVARARDIIGGASVESMASQDVRDSVRAAFEAIQADMQPLVLGRHARVFQADDDAAVEGE